MSLYTPWEPAVDCGCASAWCLHRHRVGFLASRFENVDNLELRSDRQPMRDAWGDCTVEVTTPETRRQMQARRESAA